MGVLKSACGLVRDWGAALGSILPQCDQSPSMEKREAETVFAVPRMSQHTHLWDVRQAARVIWYPSATVCLCIFSPQSTTHINGASPVQYSRAKGLQKPVCAQMNPGNPGPPAALSVCTCVCVKQIASLCRYTPWHMCMCVCPFLAVCAKLGVSDPPHSSGLGTLKWSL